MSGATFKRFSVLSQCLALAVASCADDDTTTHVGVRKTVIPPRDTSENAPPPSPGGPLIVSNAGADDGCLFGEPNDDRPFSTLLVVNKQYSGMCIGPRGSKSDADFYEFVSPDDPGGGYVVFEITNVGAAGNLMYAASATRDSQKIVFGHSPNAGTGAGGYFGVLPNEHFRLDLRHYDPVLPGEGIPSTEYKYDLVVRYTKFDEVPSRSYDRARPLTVGTPVHGYFAAGYQVGTLSERSGDDWYTITFTAPTKFKFTLTDTSDAQAALDLAGPDGSSVEIVRATSPGADVILAAKDTYPAGTQVFVRVHGWDGPIKSAGDGPTVPAHFTKPYTLTAAVIP